MRPHFHVAGFPVRVHPLFFLTTLAAGWGFARDPALLALWMAVAFAAVLIHELGHALAFRRFGCAARIDLHGMGGTAHGEDTGRLTHLQSAWVSFSGPGAGFLVGGLVWAATRLAPPGALDGRVGQVVGMWLWVNVGWGLFNLLPFQPLDGGHLLASLVRAWRGYRYERHLHVVGIATAALVAGYSVWSGQIWLGLLALTIGVMNFEQLRRLPRPAPVSAAAPRSVRIRRRSTAGAVTLDELLGRAPVAPTPPESSPAPAQAEAPQVVQETRDLEPPHDPAVVGRLLLDSGLSTLAVRPLQEAFARAPSPGTAHALVLALLEAGRTAELAALLSGPRAAHLEEEALEAIAARARTTGERSLADRVTALRHARAPKSDERG
ncbi:site-2 protease family protein [Myxococcus sp. K15C18031901]|uniref:site-2 protease family protein n=1 Tax=Myxococcus dinghuensis TaxID=2906761 RepID=UPI0020A7ABFC|nr:site-2 protease family protein [Myxococcus dinghuensis]MCP3098471.1 site-2 protease family protein [Myxococcus dinghuensis]